jgi:hypothetical protein
MNRRNMLGLLLSAVPAMAFAHEPHNPENDAWYGSLMRPDHPTQSCCGLADAYWADEVHVKDGRTYVTVRDDRDDALLGRPHVPNGTVIYVPDTKLKWDKGNPTGHGVLFMRYSPDGNEVVFCYVQPALT